MAPLFMSSLRPCWLLAAVWLWLPAHGEIKPFPFMKRMYKAQENALEELSQAAKVASAAAKPELLSLLDSDDFRALLHDCCEPSGIAKRPAGELYQILIDQTYTAELVHNFENGHSLLSLDLLFHNATDYLPSSWQMEYLGYYGNDTAELGHPASPADASEEGPFRLQPFTGPHDLPATWEEASSRVQYIALNTLRVDAGNPGFGNVSMVLAPSFWNGAIAAAPLDTGLYTFTCNQTYLNTPGSFHSTVKDYINCDNDISPGVAGMMDHVILESHKFWSNGTNHLRNIFARWYGKNESWTNISAAHLERYLETNVFSKIPLERQGVKLLVGSFRPLFGTPTGRLLQEFSRQRGIALAWAFGPGWMKQPGDDDTKGFHETFRTHLRILDPVTMGSVGLNVTLGTAAHGSFQRLWKQAEAKRDAGGTMSSEDAVSLWEEAERALPSAQMDVPSPGACADWEACLGTQIDGTCVCYLGKEIATFV